MDKAIVQLPDWKSAIINGEKVDIGDVEAVLITGSGVIPKFAFGGLHKLRYVDIADEVTGIENQVFERCESLEEIHFGKGIEYIGDYSLGGSKKLEKLVIPGNIKRIGSQSFSSLVSLKHLVIEEGVESIGQLTFDNCIELEKIDLPSDSIKHIGGSIFQKSKWLKKNKEEFITVCGILIEYKGKRNAEHVSMPDNIKAMIHGAFAYASFKEIEVGKGIKRIPNFAFHGNRDLESVLIPEGVEEIGKEVFKGCDNLKRVKVPDSLIKVGASSLKPEYLENCPKKGCVYAGKVVIGCLGDPKRIAINEGTYSIGPGAFDQAYNMEAIALPNSIREINCSFLACKKLLTIIVPQDVPASCLNAFESIKDLKIITWSQSEAMKFAEDKGIEFVCVEQGIAPEEVLKKSSKKKQPKALTTIIEASPNKWFRRSGNALAGFSSAGLKDIRNKHIKSITLPVEIDGCKIERLVFDCLSVLKEVPEVEELVIPGELKIQGLTTSDGRDCWDFPNTEIIKRLVFTGKTPINFYQHIRTFDESLESITIQESDRFVSYDGVIYSKDGKNLVYYPRSKKDRKFTVPASVTDIWSASFRNVKYLEEIVLPDGLDDISKEAFRDSSIKNINIPGGVTYIFENAFSKCKLDSVVLNEGTKWIDKYAFLECTADEVVFPTTLESIHVGAFSNSTSRFVFQTDAVMLDRGSFLNCKYTQFVGASKTMRRKIAVAGLHATLYLSPTYKATREEIINLIKTLCGEDYPIDKGASVEELKELFTSLTQN